MILLHCGFSLGATNSNIALFSMLLVAGSGIFGRYFYSTIHRGLHGRRSTLSDLQRSAHEIKERGSKLLMMPELLEHLDAEETRLLKIGGWSGLGVLAGRYEYLLLVYLGSTVDPRLGVDRHPGQNLIWLADDRAIRLVRDGRSMKEAGVSTPLYAPDHWHGRPRIYRTDRQTLLFLSSAKRLRLVLEGDDDARPFDVWTDGRRALGQLAAAGN